MPRLAEVRIDAVDVGIDAAAVVQALPLPSALPAPPRRAGALCGVVEHGGALVPVVDLARWVDTGARGDAPDARILILADAGRVLGLRVSSVGGLVDVAPEAVTRLHHDDDAEEVFHSAARSPDTGRLLSVLDVGRLAALAQAWSAGAAASLAAATSAAAPAPSARPTRPYALLDAGALRLGVPAAGLAEVLPMPPSETIAGGRGAWCTWRGRHLAIVPLADVVPGAADDGELPPLLAVLERDGLALGIPVRATLRLAQCVPPPAGEPVAIVYDEDGAELRLLDLAALFARRPEAALSRATPGRATPGRATPGRDTNGTDAHAGKPNDAAYVVFEADGLAAAPLDTLERILPLAAPPGTTLPWEGRAIPVADLRRPDAAAAGGQVLVVRAGAGHVACVVARVHLMIPAGAGRMYRMGATAFVTTDDGHARASYRTLDLTAYAARRQA